VGGVLRINAPRIALPLAITPERVLYFPRRNAQAPKLRACIDTAREVLARCAQDWSPLRLHAADAFRSDVGQCANARFDAPWTANGAGCSRHRFQSNTHGPS